MICDLITYDSFCFLFSITKKIVLKIDLCIFETVCAGALTWVMGQRYIQTSKIMPAGIVAGIRSVKSSVLTSKKLIWNYGLIFPLYRENNFIFYSLHDSLPFIAFQYTK